MVKNKIKIQLFQEKKGQIGSTLTWIVALMIIFFIILLYLAAALYLAAGKSLPIVSTLFGKDRNEIKIENENYRIESQSEQRLLQQILEEEVIYDKTEIKTKDLFLLWAANKNNNDEEKVIRETLSSKIKNILEESISKQKKYVILHASHYSLEKDKDISQESEEQSNHPIFVSAGEFFSGENIRSSIREGSSLFIYNNNNAIEIQLLLEDT